VTAYKLIKLAAGSYDVALNGVIIAGLVMSETPSRVRTWTAELLVDLPPEERPAPFVELEHHFSTFEEARAWLGNPALIGEGSGGPARDC
jgi:hypothetical protein